eukprot:m.244109 g.244109  ORF g.244109 m.244109 type:complete len:778 (-) comp33822_c3_seq5:211-2544(-)
MTGFKATSLGCQVALIVTFVACVNAAQDASCDVNMPVDWLPKCLAADLFYSDTMYMHKSNENGNGTFVFDMGQNDQSRSKTLMPELANGYFGTIAKSGVVHAGGLFNGDATGRFGPASHRASIPQLQVSVDMTGAITSVSALDIRQAIFFERTVLERGVKIEQRRYAHATRPSLFVHEIEIDGPTSGAALTVLFSSSVSATKTLTLTNMSNVGPQNWGLTGKNIIPEDATTASNGNHTFVATIANTPQQSVDVKSGQSVTLYFLQTFVTSLNSTDVNTDATTFQSDAVKAQASLMDEHVQAWARRWQRGSASVEGDLRLAIGINASLYSLRSSIRDDWPYGLSPGGLTTDGYNGHTFWDQETWMWPPLLFLDPPSAVSALGYRSDRLAGATQKANNCGKPNHAWCPPDIKFEATPFMFPWESAATGIEVQFGHGKIGQWGEFEQHISGDVSFAARQYFYATQDKVWLKNVGFPLIKGVASFYAARLQGDALNMVMGPDEYAFPVNNSRYTNAVASIAIEAAIEFSKILGETIPADWVSKVAVLPIGEAPVPPGSNLTGMYHPEYDGYPNGHRGKEVKQADTVMLSYPFGINMATETLKNDLLWYEPNTDPGGPAMTWAVFAIGWFNTGEYDKAGSRFRRGFDPNVRPPFMVWTEGSGTNYGCTPFLTGAGGFLQSIVFGTSGMRLHNDSLLFNPAPPFATGANATTITLHGFNFRGSKLTQSVTNNTVTYSVDSKVDSAEALVLVETSGKIHALDVGVPVQVERANVVIRPQARELV